MRLAAPGKVIAVFLVPCFLYLAWVAARWGLADVYARPAIITLNKWKLGEMRLGQDDWQQLQADLAWSLQLDPDNPELQQWMGTAIEGPYKSYFTDRSVGDLARRVAVEHYRRSIQLQPTWPHAWMDLANVKFRLAEIDQEFYEAVRNAVKYGPWEPGVQAAVVRLGIVLWAELPEAEKPVFRETMGNGLQHGNRNHAMNVFRQLHRTRLLADISAHDPQTVIDAVLLTLAGASRQVVRDMLVILDENHLWTQLTPEDKNVLMQVVNKSLDNANPAYTRQVQDILERNK